MYPPIVAKRFVGAFEQAYTPEGVVDAIATFRELIASYPEVPNAYHILASLLATEDALRGEDRAATLDESARLYVRASELYPMQTENWAHCIAAVFVNLVTEDSSHLAKPAWMAQDALRLEYSAQCIELAPRDPLAWEMRGTVCHGQVASWLGWEAIEPRPRALIVESVYAFKRAAKAISENTFRAERYLQRAQVSESLLHGIGIPPQYIGALDGDLVPVEEYLRDGGGVDVRDLGRCTMLYFAAEAGQTEVVNMLIEHGADRNVQIETGETPLIASVLRGHLGVFNVLMRAGVDVNLADEEGWTPLMYAAQDGRLACLGGLLAAGALVDAASTAEVDLRFHKNQTPMFRVPPRGETALLIAVKNSQGTGVVNLHAAQQGLIPCRTEHVATVAALLKAGASPTHRDARGNSPTSFALGRGMREITRLFQKHAAPLLEKRVRIHGLVSRPELNGQLGGAVSHDPRTGRYAVALDEGASDVKMSIKVRAANLEAAD